MERYVWFTPTRHRSVRRNGDETLRFQARPPAGCRTAEFRTDFHGTSALAPRLLNCHHEEDVAMELIVYVLETAARAVVPMALVLGSLAIAFKALETKAV